MTPPEQAAVCDWFAGQEPLWANLIPASRRVLATAARLAPLLGAMDQADWSPVLILIFKSLEMELMTRVWHPFRHSWRSMLPPNRATRLLETIQATRWTWPLGLFLGGGRPPSLVATAAYLGSLADIAADMPDNPLASLKHWLQGHRPMAHRLWGPSRIAHKLQEAADRLRNRYVHTEPADRIDVESALTRLWGRPSNRGVLPQALRAIMSEPPGQADRSCHTCEKLLWRYPGCLPEYHCPHCTRSVDGPLSLPF